MRLSKKYFISDPEPKNKYIYLHTMAHIPHVAHKLFPCRTLERWAELVVMGITYKKRYLKNLYNNSNSLYLKITPYAHIATSKNWGPSLKPKNEDYQRRYARAEGRLEGEAEGIIKEGNFIV